MDDAEALEMIRSEKDSTVKMLLLAALVSERFRKAGFEPVVVGGSAIEAYTEGAYRSGDIDICFAGFPLPQLKARDDVLAGIPAENATPRTLKIEGLFLDILGEIETLSEKGYGSLETPIGQVVLQPVEDLLVERVYIGFAAHTPNGDAADCAETLSRNILLGKISVDWEEAYRLADSPAYECLNHLKTLRSEVESKL